MLHGQNIWFLWDQSNLISIKKFYSLTTLILSNIKRHYWVQGKFKFSGPLHFSQLWHKTRPFIAYTTPPGKTSGCFEEGSPPHKTKQSKTKQPTKKKKTPPLCTNLVWCFPRRTCKHSRRLQKATKTITLKKSCTSIRVSKILVSRKKL